MVMKKEEYDGSERRQWHVKKEVSLGDLFAFSSAALAVVYAYTTLDKRLALVETSIVAVQIAEATKREDFQQYQNRIDKVLHDINAKLDRLVERTNSR